MDTMSISKYAEYGKHRMMKYFNVNDRQVTCMIYIHTIAVVKNDVIDGQNRSIDQKTKTGEVILFTLTIAEDDTIWFKDK